MGEEQGVRGTTQHEWGPGLVKHGQASTNAILHTIRMQEAVQTVNTVTRKAERYFPKIDHVI